MPCMGVIDDAQRYPYNRFGMQLSNTVTNTVFERS